MIFAVALVLGLISFNYDGKLVVDADECGESTMLVDNNRFVKRVRKWMSADGKLQLRTTETVYKQFPVREILPELVCVGETETGIVDDFRSFSLSRMSTNTGLRLLRGTVNTDQDFVAVDVTVGEGKSATNVFSQVCTEGRSSAQWMPWIGLDFADGNGVEVAIGWSGAWRADYAFDKGVFKASAGMVKTHFKLFPGETIRQPSILVFKRDKSTSPLSMQTLIHRFMINEKCPRDDKGELLKPILPITAGGGNKTPAMMKKVIDWKVKNDMPFDCFWVDAGWNGPAHMPDLISNCGNMWYHFVGDWRFNPTIHPAGNLGSIADYAHASGMRMLLWVEPERCVSDPPPPVYKEHREWILPKSDAKIKSKRNLNVNLGDEGAFNWVLETVSTLVKESKLDIYRQDFNMDPLQLWQENDAPDRQGITEAKYIAGLYRFWDELCRRFPHLVIENCASGGRRLDFEAVSRAHSYCRTDYAIYHRGPTQITDMQRTTLNTLAYQPFQGSESTPARFFDDYGFVSSICAGTVFTPSDWHAGIVKNPFTPEETDWLKRMFSLADRVRKFFSGDFYPLTCDRDVLPPEAEPFWYRGNDDERRWCAYQMHRADLNAGFVAVFRRLDTPSHVFEASLGGVDDAAQYEVETFERGVKTLRGSELRKLRLEMREPRSFRMIFYRKIGN